MNHQSDLPPKIRLIAHPYSGAVEENLVSFLVRELLSGKWVRFSAAVAYARSSGNWESLIGALSHFSENNGWVELTFGANTQSNDPGTDFEAIECILTRLNPETTRLHLYHEKGKLFHPKVYLFSNEETESALLVIGSSNWTRGGFSDNIELNVVLSLDLLDPNDLSVYRQTNDLLETFWQEAKQK